MLLEQICFVYHSLYLYPTMYAKTARLLMLAILRHPCPYRSPHLVDPKVSGVSQQTSACKLLLQTSQQQTCLLHTGPLKAMKASLLQTSTLKAPS